MGCVNGVCVLMLACRMPGMGETPFFRSERQRYCRIAQMNFSPERNRGPELTMIE